MPPQQAEAQLRIAEGELVTLMQGAVLAELERTIARWNAAGSPPTKWLRATPGNQEDEQLLKAWTWLGANLVYGGRPWEAALGEHLYQAAVDLAITAEQNNPGLDLHKGIDYFMLGMAQFYQGRLDEAVHNVLRAVAEDRDAGTADADIFAAQKLDERVIPQVAAILSGPAAACRASGLVHITDAFVDQMLRAMCFDGTGAYCPVWLLWLHSAVMKLSDLPGPSPLVPVRRLEALQDLSFMYEAMYKGRGNLGHVTLLPVVRHVGNMCHHPGVVETRWSEFTRFGVGKIHTSPEAALAALMGEQFAPLAAEEVCVCKSVLALGLVRNTAHHEMNLQSGALGAHYAWVRGYVLRALLVSWW